jgi:hypothetical protein
MKNFSNQHKKYFSKKAFVSLVGPLNNTKFLPRLIISSILILISPSSFGYNNESSLPLGSQEMIDSISKNKIKFAEIPVDFLNNKKFILELVSKESQTYKALPEKFKADKEVIKIAFSKDYIPLEYMPDSIKNDENFILELVRINPELLSSDFKQKNSPYFKQKVKEMLIKKEIKFDVEGPNSTNSFLNLLYFSEYAHDDGKALHLKLRNGNYTKIRHIEEESDTEFYQLPYFWGYLKDLGFYVVNIVVTEGSDVYLINDVTGEKFHIHNSYPIFSPDKKYLVYADGTNGFIDQFNGIEIFEISPHNVRTVYKKEFQYGDFYLFHSWKENNSFLINSKIHEDGKEKYEKYMLVYKNNSGWNIKEFKSEDSVKKNK